MVTRLSAISRLARLCLVSDEAINWIWADNIAPIGEEVWVF